MTLSGDHRCTPESVLEPVRLFAGNGRIDTDPCANEWSTVHASREYREHQDGLARQWHGLTWVNGPWSCLLPWARKGVEETRAGRCELLFWGPCYPETAWAKVLWAERPVVCFWAKRVNHPIAGKLSSGSMWPTMLVYLGDSDRRFERVFSEHGTIMRVL